VIHDRATLEAAIERMAGEIAPEYTNDARAPLYITVMHGGLPFAASLAMELGTLGIDLEFDYLHATRYRGQTSGSGLAWLHRPATPMQGRRVLLADDILDEGHTLLAVKVHDRCVEGVCADYVGVELPDRYVFGYGMDYHEQGRNLPAIYALAE
jgi:hypoxanthine phosphoribosyltransferase